MIYIQKDKHTGLPHHFDVACALYGAIDTCQDYKLISYEDLKGIIWPNLKNLARKNLFVGSVEFMKEIFKELELGDVRLPRNSNRIGKIITLQQALKANKDGEKIFIKPVDIKLFTGFVMEGFNYSCLKDLPMDTKLLAYEAFKCKIESEWRLYIHKGKIVDSRHYSGDLFVNPDYGYAMGVITSNPDMPIAYTMDIGVLADDSNVVIEFNDMWAIGNYGMPNDLYIQMLKDRYFEIINHD